MSDASASGVASAGALLRQAREAAHVHVEALAVSLKVPARQVDALEADRVDLLPDAVFARALAASVCRQLKVDPAPILALLPQDRPDQVRDAGSLNQPFRTPGALNAPAWREWLRRPAVVVALALVLGALLLLVLPGLQGLREGLSADEPATPASAPASAAAATGAPAASEPAVAPSSLVIESAPTAQPGPATVPAATTPAASGRTP